VRAPRPAALSPWLDLGLDRGDFLAPEAAAPGRFAMIRTLRSSSEIFASGVHLAHLLLERGHLRAVLEPSLCAARRAR